MSGSSGERASLLVVNVGSSSCKVTVVEGGVAREVDAAEITSGADVDRWRTLVERHDITPDVILHRFVHGGGVFHEPTRITASVRAGLDALIPLAPLHTANALGVVEALAQLFPDAVAIACFDTSFHETMSPAAFTYAIPPTWRQEHGIRKYGFHGFAHAYADRRARQLLPGRPISRVLSCHLGSGSSLAAIVDGSSVDTTMGFTPVDGLVMASRPGSLDPGALAWLVATSALDAAELSDALEHRSGLTGLTGQGDLKAIMADAGRGDPTAALAVDVWLHRLVSLMGSMIASMGGVDLIVFGGGIGENAGELRSAAATSLAFLGVSLDEDANRTARSDAIISAANSAVACVVVTAREALAMISAAMEAGLIDPDDLPIENEGARP